MLAGDNAIHVAYLYVGEVPDATVAYERTKVFCGKTMNVCDVYGESSLLDAYHKSSDKKCWMCRQVRNDFVGVTNRYEYLDRNTILRLVDDACESISLRYPKPLNLKLEVCLASSTVVPRT